YPIATFRDAPEEINVHVMGDETKPSTGVGEPGTVPVAAAIANAIFAACGARVRELPISAARVRRARPKGQRSLADTCRLGLTPSSGENGAAPAGTARPAPHFLRRWA